MFIYLISKIMPLIFSPLGLIIIFLIIYLINKKRKFLYFAICLLWFFSVGFFSKSLLRLAEYPWEGRNINSLAFSEAIVVLGGGGMSYSPGKNKQIEWSDPDRFLAGIKLFKAGKAKKIIFTGGINPLYPNIPPEGEIYIEEAINIGLRKNNLISTRKVVNTIQEAEAINDLLHQNYKNNKKRIILVTSAFHMQRAKKIFEKFDFIVDPFPVDFKSNNISKEVFYDPYNWIPNANSLKESSIAFREFLGRTIYNSW